MIAKALAAAALLASSVTSPALAPAIPTDEPSTDMNAIALIQCGRGRGTAFWIDDTRLITAAHVTSLGDCRTVEGNIPLETVHENGAMDIAELRGPDISHELSVRCDGMEEGSAYFATGFSQGIFRHTSRLLATRLLHWENDGNGLTILFGVVYAGMSGGPVVDTRGRVVGIINRRGVDRPFSFSRSLADTYLCGDNG